LKCAEQNTFTPQQSKWIDLKYIHEGDLISESFSLWLKPPKTGAKSIS
jgi:hypothetical protein